MSLTKVADNVALLMDGVSHDTFNSLFEQNVLNKSC